jgi:hypothetical protein
MRPPRRWNFCGSRRNSTTFLQVFLGFVDARNLIEGDRSSGLQQLGLGLADGHQTTCSTLLAHAPAHHPDHDADHQRERQQRQQQATKQTRLWRRLGLDHDTLLLQLGNKAGALRDIGRDSAARRTFGNDLLPLDGHRADLALVDCRDEGRVGKLLRLGC